MSNELAALEGQQKLIEMQLSEHENQLKGSFTHLIIRFPRSFRPFIHFGEFEDVFILIFYEKKNKEKRQILQEVEDAEKNFPQIIQETERKISTCRK
jgi:hypothetical protein